MHSCNTKCIGLLTWDFNEPRGGLGRALQEDVAVLHRAGYRLRVFSPRPGVGQLPLLPSIRRNGGHVLFSLLLGRPLRERLKKEPLDSLLVPVGPGGIFLGSRPPVRRLVAVVYHTYLQQSRSVPGEAWKKMFIGPERRTLGFADRIFCYSDDARNVLIRDYGFAPESVVLLPQILRPDEWTAQPDPLRVPLLCVCVGRLDRRKGVAMLLKAWLSVVQRHPGAHLVLVGEGSHGRLPVGVTHIPRLPLGDLVALVRRASLALCPSYLEGYGLAAAEAQMAGTPVIASDCDGLRSLVAHNETGWRVRAGHADLWGEAISTLLQDDALRALLGDNGRRAILRKASGAQQAWLDAVGAVLSA